jgi:DNA-binding winged helix-turn-helix (wHTH) protein
MVYIFGSSVLDTERRELRHRDVVVGLERKIYRVLLHLVEHRNRLVPKEELLERLWPGVYVEEGAVARCIFAARRAVGDDRDRQDVIKTVHGQGYRFVAPVTMDTGTPLAGPAIPAAPELAVAAPPDAAPRPAPLVERKAATVLCGVLTPTPSGLLGLDAEQALAESLAALVGSAVAPYEGVVQRLGSDGFTVVFGVPRAQEDHARRAVLAALALQRGWPALAASLATGERSSTLRLALHTSPVAVADPGGAFRGAVVVVGEAPRLAGALARDAPPGTVVISGATHRLVQSYFECEGLDPVERALDCPGTAERYRVVHQGQAESPFDVSVRRGLTRLVGREEEFRALLERWDHAKTGEGHVVLIGGEAGIGKSRLARALAQRLGSEACAPAVFQCSPYHRHSALHPVIEYLQRVLGFTPGDSPETRLVRLERALVRYRSPRADTLPLLAALLSLPHPAASLQPDLSQGRLKQRMQEILAAWFFEEGGANPACCIWEDLQWADPATVELLGLYLDQVPSARMLVLVTFRPEFLPPWGPRSYLSALTLRPLDLRQTVEMVAQVAGARALPSGVLDELVARTGGVPLFIEELTRAVVEADAREPIPVALQDSLMARLDRLEGAKEVAQAAAVLGREFSYGLLAAAARWDEVRLQRDLGRLVQAEFLHQRGLPPAARYRFKHALVQEVAYGSMPRSRRRALHAQAAYALEQRFEETDETRPELIAHHYTEAGEGCRSGRSAPTPGGCRSSSPFSGDPGRSP